MLTNHLIIYCIYSVNLSFQAFELAEKHPEFKVGHFDEVTSIILSSEVVKLGSCQKRIFPESDLALIPLILVAVHEMLICFNYIEGKISIFIEVNPD